MRLDAFLTYGYLLKGQGRGDASLLIFMKYEKGWHTEKIYPILQCGNKHHVTRTLLDENQEVVMAISNMCGGIVMAAGMNSSQLSWERISHFEDAEGNRYEKSEMSQNVL